MKSVKKKPALTKLDSLRIQTPLCLPVIFILLITSLAPARQSEARNRAEQLLKQGEQEMRQDRDAAINSFEESLGLARSTGDYSLVSIILLKLSAAYLDSREYEKSLAAAEEAITAARQAGDRRKEAWSLEQAGNAHYSMGKFISAFEDFVAAVSIMREVGDRLGEAIALKDTGILCKYLRKYDEAFSYLNEASKIFRELNDRTGLLSTLHNIGVGYAVLGAHRLALEAYEEALEVARENNDLTGAGHVLTRIGYLVRDRELGLEYLNQALALAENLKLYDLQVEVLSGISDALAETGQLDEAIRAQKRALQINSKWNSRIATELNGLGHLYLRRDPTVAVDYFRRSLALAQKESESPLVISPHYGLARAYRQQGRLDLAIDHYQHAIDLIESVRSRLVSDHFRATFTGQFQRIYNGLIEALMERHQRNANAGDDRRAFAVLERAKARSIVEAIAEGRLGIRDELDEDQNEKLLNARIAELQERLIQPEVSAEDRRQLQQRLSHAEQEFDRLKVEIKLRNPRYAAMTYPDPVSIEEARRLLDDRTAIVAYLLANEGVFVFIVTSSTFRTERIPVAADVIRARVQNYVDLIEQEDGDGWQEVSRRLYADLVSPIRKHLDPTVDRLVLMPDDALHYLAFETLIQDNAIHAFDPLSPSSRASVFSRPSIGRYLLQDFTISYAPSATVLAELAGSESGQLIGGQANIAVFANPSFAPALLAENSSQVPPSIARSLYAEEGLQVTRIPFSATEAQAIERYAGPESKIYTGVGASESRIKADQLDRFRVIHFATHGLISQQTPARSALVLTPGADEDGFLQVREIYQLRLQTDLVVLSACQTATGQLLAGEGVRGLAQAFFFAGAKSVVASLWDVNDERTTLFMEAFYRHLSDQKSKAEALRAAKLELLGRNPAASPRSWAAFVLMGEANETVPVVSYERFGDWLPTGVALCIGALTALLVVLRQVRGRREKEGNAKSQA